VIDYHLARAWALYQDHSYIEAIDQLKLLLGTEPGNAEGHGLLAACLLEQKRLAAAEYELALALRFDPRQAFFYLVQAELLLLKNQRNLALAACDQAQQLVPDEAAPLFKKVRILLLYDKYREAKETLDIAAALQPNALEVPLFYCQICMGLGEKEGAEIFAREALALSPQTEEANILMGKIRLAQGDNQGAAEHAKLVIMNNPDSNSGLALLADIKARNNFFLGVWWRLNNYLSHMPAFKQVSLLIGGFLVFSLLAQILSDLGFATTARIVGIAWVGLVVYSWIAIPLYTKMIKKELKKFEFNQDF